MAAPESPFRVGIAGGGVAGITALMALADLGERRFHVDLICPGDHFVLRPQLIGAPWGGTPLHLDLGDLAASFGAEHHRATLARVDPAEGAVLTTDGISRRYDAVLVATGARLGVAYSGVRTIGFGGLPDELAQPSHRSVAVVVPPGTSWTFPAYQLALLTAASTDADVRVVTPEQRPLEVFGPGVTDAVAAFLARHRVQVELGRSVVPGTDEAHDLADDVIALAVLHGPHIVGLPTVTSGFIPVDEDQRVQGLRDVFAAGDVTAGAIKQGGLAAQQAERAATEIVLAAGMSAPERVESAALRGKLVAGDDALYLRRYLEDKDSEVAHDKPLWKPEASLLAWRLSRWLVARGPAAGVDPLGPLAHPDVSSAR